MKRLSFYIFVMVVVVLNSLLLSSPNLLGRVGLIIYKYHYLRTFPRTLLTVAAVVLIAVAIAEFIRLLVKTRVIRRVTGVIILLLFVLASVAMLVKTALDFSTWTYSHTGQRFRYGAYLLPVVLILIFVYTLFSLPKAGITLSGADGINETREDNDSPDSYRKRA